MGRLIPGGTGLAAYKALNLVVEGDAVDQERYAPPPSQAMLGGGLSAVNEE